MAHSQVILEFVLAVFVKKSANNLAWDAIENLLLMATSK
jgi:hypothetical protein